MAATAVWLVLLAVLCATVTSAGQRFAVTYTPGTDEGKVLAQLTAAGYTVAKHYRDIHTFAVHAPESAAAAVSAASHSRRLSRLDGVRFAEVDQPRAAILPFPGTPQAMPTSACSQQCLFKDKPSPTVLRGSILPPETLPWGVQMVQGTAELLQPKAPLNYTFICLIDSGLDRTHPDMTGNALGGCLPYQYHVCPLPWYEADFEHGTHVAGILAAVQNGVGVIGVIPGGATIYSIKVFDSTGRNIYYTTDFVNVYQHCELVLDVVKLALPGAPVNMVVSMSLGGNGSSALEALYFKKAGLRGDIMWVAAAGNAELPVGQPEPGPDYPAGYAEVISVGAVDCNGTQASFSQANPDVELVGPGVNVLSDLAAGQLVYSALLNTTRPVDVANITYGSPAPVSGVSGALAGTASAVGRLVYCGLGASSCSGATGNVCLFLRGTYTFLQKIMTCQASGGLGAIIFNSANNPGCLNINPSYLSNNSLIPGVTITGDQGVALKTLLDANVTVVANMSVTLGYELTYVLSGTSMAAPHVSASAVRVWNLFPKCKAEDVRAALRSSAKHMGKGAGTTRNYEYGYGIVQAADAAVALSKAKCARP